MSDQEIMQLSQKIAEQAKEVKGCAGNYIFTHSHQSKYEAIKQLLSIICTSSCIIEQINRSDFSAIVTEKVEIVSITPKQNC